MNSNDEFHLIVVGGGPGGATLATLVAMHNYRVLLLERELFPRYQIGESLLPATVHGICVILGVSERLKKAGFVRKRGGTFLWGKNPLPWTFDFGMLGSLGESAGYAYQVERSKFDHILLSNAKEKGVDVREQHSVTSVITENDRVVGVTFTDDKGGKGTARARFVADASGHQTVLARTVGERIASRFFQNIALFGYFEGGKRLPPPNQGNILCASFEDGWFWYIPLSDNLTSVGAVVDREYANKLRGSHDLALQGFIERCPIIKSQLAVATRVTTGPYGELRVRKDYSYTNARFWKPGIVLVGDAACFIDPVFSSGVHLATYSALLAARSINTALQGDIEERSCFEEFELRYRREFENFYHFLLSFYDTNSDEGSYFWNARKVLNTDESANDAFLRLVAGISNEQMHRSAENTVGIVQHIGRLIGKEGQMYFPSLETSKAGPDGVSSDSFMNDLLSGVVHVQHLASMGARRGMESPQFPGGLIASADGLRWCRVQNLVCAKQKHD